MPDTIADSMPPDTIDSGGDTVASDTKDSGPDVAVASKACIDCMNVNCSDLHARCVAFKSCPFLDCALACKTAACINECDKKIVGGDTQAEAVTCMTGACAGKCTTP